MSTIYSSAKQFTDTYSKQFNLVATIFDTDLSNSAHVKKLTKEQYLEFGESTYVKEMQIVASISVILEELKATDEQNSAEIVITGTYASQLETMQKAINDSGLEKHLAKSNQKLIEGRETLKLNECVVSEELARVNQLKIGDKVAYSATEGDKQELTIVGIYQRNQEDRADQISGISVTHENQIFTNLETVTKAKGFDKYGYTSVSYILKNTAVFPKFKEELQKKGLSDKFQITTNEANLKLILNPVNSIKTMAGISLLGILIIGSFSLVFLSVRQFKKNCAEITVMRNIGISKKELVMSHLIELAGVTAAAFSIACVLTAFTVQPFADWQLAKQNQLSSEISQLANLFHTADVKAISTIPMTINYAVILGTLGAALSFLFIILTVDSYKIFKFEPIEFLLERNFDE